MSMPAKSELTFAQYSNSESENTLRDDLQLLQSLAQDATDNTNVQPTSDLGAIAAQASRAAILTHRPDQPNALPENENFLHSTGGVQNTSGSNPQVTQATLAAPVPEATMIPVGMALNPNVANVINNGAGGSLPVHHGITHQGLLDNNNHSSNGRQLSTTKRAAQNRAAQRAFRQRKENHIKMLEAENATYQEKAMEWKVIENQNIALRQWCHQLQSCLVEAQIPVPSPPQALAGIVNVISPLTSNGGSPQQGVTNGNSQVPSTADIAAAAVQASQAQNSQCVPAKVESEMMTTNEVEAAPQQVDSTAQAMVEELS